MKSLTILIANFSPRLHTLVIVYTIYFLLKPLNTVLTVLEKENTITSCLMLNFRCIKTFINRCLFKFRWYSVCFVLFLMFYVFYSFLSSFRHTALKATWLDLTWLEKYAKLGKAAKLRSVNDIRERNPVPASGLWSGSGSKVNQFVHIPTSVDTQNFIQIHTRIFE